MSEELTPMQRQYRAIKRELPSGAILMFRLGDFYEMFGEDAIIAAPILGATLTQRAGSPLCGVPYHALDAYLAKLIRAGKTAAICEQMEDPKLVKKGQVVRREVTRIVTPGTVTEDGLIDENLNHYIASAVGTRVKGAGAGVWALALMDLSTGEFTVEEFSSEAKLVDAISRYRPAELILPKADDEDEACKVISPAALAGFASHIVPAYAESWTFAYDTAREELLRHFRVLALDGFGLERNPEAVKSAGALVYYVHTTLRHQMDHVRTIRLRRADEFLSLDAGTIRHLSLLPTEGMAREATLLGVLDVTRTPMGARHMAAKLRQPLSSSVAINRRLDAVETFVKNRTLISRIQALLGGVRDLERLIAKAGFGRANARDLKALASSLRPVPEIKAMLLAEAGAPIGGELESVLEELQPEPETVELIDKAITENPNVLISEGNLIAAGFNAELDELRSIATEGHRWLMEYQAREIERTGIKTLKVRHNNVFGYYIEISKALTHLAPPEYERRQTLTTGERYVTAELKTYEHKVLGAQNRACALEQELFKEVLEAVKKRCVPIQTTAGALGEIDVLVAFADRALAAGYVRPVVDDSDVLEMIDSRHPIIEQLADAEPFVPNSAMLDCAENQIMLITGPNMAGKSTYIRQVATIAVMAQAGCFVPASSMRLGVLDRVFTRIGAGDDLSRGRSTFLVEMQETANILNNATGRSLIVLDEIGRGTSTFDGISIAWSVAEYLHENSKVKAKTLFATHYHELTDLAERFRGVKNWTVRVKQEGERIIFLRRVVPGVAEKSFGIHVAAMAGLPKAVVSRATVILKNLEANELDVESEKMVRRPRRRLSDLPGQMTFF